jgi:hypothetical protein
MTQSFKVARQRKIQGLQLLGNSISGLKAGQGRPHEKPLKARTLKGRFYSIKNKF